MSFRPMRDMSQAVNITNVFQLLEVGVDRRSITATINYSAPQMRIPGSLALDSDADLLISSAHRGSVYLQKTAENRPAKMKTRKGGRFTQSTATKN